MEKIERTQEDRDRFHADMKRIVENCEHDWHLSTKPLSMVIPDGHIVQACCKCGAVRTVHRAHA